MGVRAGAISCRAAYLDRYASLANLARPVTSSSPSWRIGRVDDLEVSAFCRIRTFVHIGFLPIAAQPTSLAGPTRRCKVREDQLYPHFKTETRLA